MVQCGATMPFFRLLRRKRFSLHRPGGAFARAGSCGPGKIQKRGGGVADCGTERPPMPMPSGSSRSATWDGLGRSPFSSDFHSDGTAPARSSPLPSARLARFHLGGMRAKAILVAAGIFRPADSGWTEYVLALARGGDQLLQSVGVDRAGHELVADHEGRRAAHAERGGERHVVVDDLLQLRIFHVLLKLGDVEADRARDLHDLVAIELAVELHQRVVEGEVLVLLARG